MAKVKISQFSGTNKSITYLGAGYWGGWAPETTITNTTAVMFDFTSPSKALDAVFTFYPDFAELEGSKNAGFILEFNGEVVLESKNENAAGGRSDGILDNTIPVMMAPLTRVVFKCSTNDTDGLPFTCAFKGREVDA